MCGVTKLDKIRKERIRVTTIGGGGIAKKVQESRLKCYGHVTKREEYYVGRMVLEMKVQGRRKIGRYKRRCLDRVRDDIEENGPSARRRCTIVLHGGYSIVHRPHIIWE